VIRSSCRDEDERNEGMAFLEAQVYRLSEMLSVSSTNIE